MLTGNELSDTRMRGIGGTADVNDGTVHQAPQRVIAFSPTQKSDGQTFREESLWRMETSKYGSSWRLPGDEQV
jgi:hypothetical protein